MAHQPLNRRAEGREWAIATPHALATEAGRGAFESGGNALDAALAAAAVLTVVYPHMCALGGDLIGVHRAPDGDVAAVLGVGAAPTAADPERLRHDGPMPFYGPHTVTVPGLLSGWQALADRGARHGLAAALAPAAEHARAGVPLAGSVARALDAPRESERLASDPGLRSLFFAAGQPLRAGEVLCQPALAETLRAICTGGIGSFYGGEVGESLVAGLAPLGVPLSLGDLSRHAVELAEPLRGRFGAVELVTAPPVSQGFVLLAALAALAELREADPQAADAGSLAEIFRLAAADRDQWLGDPERVAPPLHRLLSAEHAAELAGLARRRPRDGVEGDAAAARAPASGDTIALVAADAEGQAVSLVQSLYSSFGAGILEPSTGIICQNRGAGFTLDPDSPNVMAPGKRPAHTLTPLLALRDRGLSAVLGTMGGRPQPQILAQVLLELLAGSDPGDALDAPRWMVIDELPDVVAEGRVGRGTLAELERAGFQCRLAADWDEALGHTHAITFGADGFVAASDRRSDGAAAAG